MITYNSITPADVNSVPPYPILARLAPSSFPSPNKPLSFTTYPSFPPKYLAPHLFDQTPLTKNLLSLYLSSLKVFTMASCATTPTTLPSPPLRRISPLHSSRFPTFPFPRPYISQRLFSCQVAVTSDVSSSVTSEEEAEAAAKVGKKVRVTVPLRVYHVMKKPDLDLFGMEGVIKQYVAIWKGRRVTPNLPFKVEFFIEVDGQDKPVKVLAHLREDEFEYVD